jgi:hypothetical protein
MPQNCMKKLFLGCFILFSYKNWPNDLVRGLFSSLDVSTYIPPTCGPLCTFLGLLGGGQMPQSGIENLFSDCSSLFLPQEMA